jgi:hypothetical protein
VLICTNFHDWCFFYVFFNQVLERIYIRFMKISISQVHQQVLTFLDIFTIIFEGFLLFFGLKQNTNILAVLVKCNIFILLVGLFFLYFPIVLYLLSKT